MQNAPGNPNSPSELERTGFAVPLSAWNKTRPKRFAQASHNLTLMAERFVTPRRATAVAILAIAGIALLGFSGSVPDPVSTKREAATQHSPENDNAAISQVPRVEPLEFEPLAAEQARLINNRIPILSNPGPAARPFAVTGSMESQLKATDCLASAMWYEAGSSTVGQLAVGQVVLNRVKHPAFPKSVCGVVFQGAERRTGCQFTFTCDGAMARRPSIADFAAAQQRARAMLNGFTFPAVGLATHYHTDWVHPAWSVQMDKIAQIETHLFFRWHGTWGQYGAMKGIYNAKEPAIAAMAALSPIHAAMPDDAALQDGTVGKLADDNAALLADPSSLPSTPSLARQISDALVVSLAGSGGDGTRQALGALGKCGNRNVCKLIGYLDEDKQRIAFLYVRDRRDKVEQAFWDCTLFQRAQSSDCLTTETRRWLNYTPRS